MKPGPSQSLFHLPLAIRQAISGLVGVPLYLAFSTDSYKTLKAMRTNLRAIIFDSNRFLDKYSMVSLA